MSESKLTIRFAHACSSYVKTVVGSCQSFDESLSGPYSSSEESSRRSAGLDDEDPGERAGLALYSVQRSRVTPDRIEISHRPSLTILVTQITMCLSFMNPLTYSGFDARKDPRNRRNVVRAIQAHRTASLFLIKAVDNQLGPYKI